MPISASLRRAPATEPAVQVPPEPPQAARTETNPVIAVQPAVQTPAEAPKMSASQFLRHHWRAAGRTAKDMADREGSVVNGLLAGKPPSVAEQRDYLHNRRWLPDGHELGIADILGVGYHWAYGIWGVALGNAISALAAKPFRAGWALFVAALTVASAVFVDAHEFGHESLSAAGSTAFTTMGMLVAVAVGWWLLVTGVIVAYRAWKARGSQENPES